MATPIPDGTYSIQSVQFPDSIIDLNGANPYGVITGFSREASTNLLWIVKNVGNNQISLESVTAPGYYLAVDYYVQSAPTLGSPNPSYWTVNEVAKGKYTLGAKGFLLTLFLGGNIASIFLDKEAAPGNVSQWTFVLAHKST